MLLGLGTFVSHAAAHAPPLGLQLVWVDPAPEALPYVLSNRGLIYPNLNHQDGPDSAFSLRCYDAYHVNTSAVPRVVTNSQNALVLQTTDGVSTTSDRGCTWTEGTGLPDLSLGGFVQSPSAPNKMLVTTQIYEKPAQIFESTDYGRSWTVKATNAPYTIYSELLTSADGLHVFAAGKRYDVAKNNLFPVWASSSDGGATWTDQDVGTPRLPLGLLGDDGMVVFAHEPDPVTTLDPHDKLLRSEDGGQTFEMVANPAPISSFVATPDGATLWVGTTSGGLLRSRDRGKTFTQVDPDEVAGITCLHYHGNRLWVCANFMPNTNGIWYSTDQGDSFTMALDFTEVLTEVSCQPEAEAICHQPWLDWQYELATNFTVDAGTPLP
ncbi:MAG: hypothetical protein JWN48_4401, partial [Myxococcaceae bacterium]|nr:hypothetical protein [Myxococcaceae bacterium]